MATYTVYYTLSGGTPPYTTSLIESSIVVLENIDASDATYTFEDVPSGVYTIQSIDDIGCQTERPITLT